MAVAMAKRTSEFSRRVFFVIVTPATIAEAYDPGADEERARYRETDDVKAFYRTNGYES
jgi:hypothetical protein